jgi:hypothetical protein
MPFASLLYASISIKIMGRLLEGKKIPPRAPPGR